LLEDKYKSPLRYDVSRLKFGKLELSPILPDSPMTPVVSVTRKAMPIFNFMSLPHNTNLLANKNHCETPKCTSSNVNLLKLALAHKGNSEDELNSDDDDEIPEETKCFTPKSNRNRGLCEVHKSFEPEMDEHRVIPTTPGSDGGSRSTLTSSTHLTYQMPKSYASDKLKPIKRMSQFHKEFKEKELLEAVSGLIGSEMGKEETVASEASPFTIEKIVQEIEPIDEDGFSGKWQEINQIESNGKLPVKRVSGKKL